jgi:hypothetical protein
MANPVVLVRNGENISGKHRRNFFDLTGPASYVNGTGVAIAPAVVGMKTIITLDFTSSNAAGLAWVGRPVIPATGGNQPSFVRFYVQATGAEVANAVNLSTGIFRFEAAGY